ncbi:VWA domain-containing protein [Amphritea atlantica]|uniref:VWA domain-containing protein n=1 Tax=Amphritea atlantica TaxID=355243 RepID=A0ABY5GX49_9GAMM|nr:VWA domain-containing protein [Amphritea atlantica]
MRDKHPVSTVSSNQEIEEFLKQAQQLTAPAPGDARLIFSLDATASRERTWDHACHLQSEMFLQTRELGKLSVQLCHYGGLNQFSASEWLQDTNSLLNRMNSVKCLGGHTQIARLLEHSLKQTRQHPVQAIIFIGDCVEEPVDFLCQLAGKLGIHSTPLFIFQEGHDITAAHAFKQMAKLSGGAYCRFDNSSAATLKALLSAVAVYATGGRRALLEYAKKGNPDILKLTHQLK